MRDEEEIFLKDAANGCAAMFLLAAVVIFLFLYAFMEVFHANH